MPAQYVRLRDKLKREGLSDKEAKERAAKIFNSQNPGKGHLLQYKRKKEK